MTNEQIRQRQVEIKEVIAKAKVELSELQENCNHEKTHMGQYSWRLGSSLPAEICDYCGHAVFGNY